MPRKKTPPVPVPAGHKYCFKCKTVKPIKAFNRDKSRRDGRRDKCSVCDNAASMKCYWTAERIEQSRKAAEARHQHGLAMYAKLHGHQHQAAAHAG